MCGIIGSFSSGSLLNADQAFRSGAALQRHRGPDDNGEASFVIDGAILKLGHQRLSIIDLTHAGHQPMCSADGRFVIVFNGEIYNYRELRAELKTLGMQFHSDSDTEVLLGCWLTWGERCLARFIGMFAFAVYDAAEKSLTLARDPFGIKPLFYSVDHSRFAFASEIPALLQIRERRAVVNPQRVYDYLVNGVQDTGFDTFVDGVHHLPPGYVLRLQLSAQMPITEKRWWNPSIVERRVSFKDAAEQLRELFLQSVRLHLRSDVPVGVALSGGVDSSAIACAVRYLEPELDLHTFSFIATGTSYSEEPWIDVVNLAARAVAHKVSITASDLEAELPDLIRCQGEPFCTTSMYAQYRVFKLARATGTTVVLEGQGGDELLAGYHGYAGQRMRSMWECGEWAGMLRFARQWRRWPGRSGQSAWRALVGQMLPDSLYNIIGGQPVPRWLDIQQIKSLDVETHPARFPRGSSARCRRVAEVLLRAMSDGGLPSLLRYGDRNAMRFSIENRVPFLTLPLAEYVLQLPEEHLISMSGETKCVFRAAMRGIVPDIILDRRDKIGFETPMGEWAASIGRRVAQYAAIETTGTLYHSDRIRARFQNSIGSSISAQDWRLMNLVLWQQEIGVAGPTSP